MIVSILFGVAMLFVALKFVFGMRYEFVHFLLYLVSKLNNHRFKLARTASEIKQALLLSDKGTGIEEMIACPAWLPILSIESVNGEQWLELKHNFLHFQKAIPSKEVLCAVTAREIRKAMSANVELNAKMISILTLKVFANWIFQDEEEEQAEETQRKDVLSDEMLERVYESSVEYRKEIAVKGAGCMRKKQDAIDIIVPLLNAHPKYSALFDDWSRAEHYSAVMQPFIISPMINVSDIAVSIEKNARLVDHSTSSSLDINAFIDYCIGVSHPFPILERYDAKTNTQIFIDMKMLTENEKFHVFNYGYGPRACLGRLYARDFLREFFEPVLDAKYALFKPHEHHLYSGRDNDNENLSESIYQLKVFGSALYQLALRRLKKSPA